MRDSTDAGFKSNRTKLRSCFLPLVGNICAGDNFGQSNAYQEFSWYGVPLSEGAGFRGSHVSLRDARGPRQQLRRREFAGNRLTFNQDECEGRALVVYAEHHAGSTENVLSFNAVFSGLNTSLSPSKTNQTGATCGRPSERTVATFAVRFPKSRNACHSLGVMDFMVGTPD